MNCHSLSRNFEVLRIGGGMLQKCGINFYKHAAPLGLEFIFIHSVQQTYRTSGAPEYKCKSSCFITSGASEYKCKSSSFITSGAPEYKCKIFCFISGAAQRRHVCRENKNPALTPELSFSKPQL
jgi:hypothetical protein